MCARYYPNGSGTNIHNDDNPLRPGNNHATFEDNAFATWLYTAEWNDENLSKFYALYAVEPTKTYIDYLLDRRADQEYLNRYGITSSDIHDPRKLRTTSSASRLYGYAIESVSDNFKRLYK